MRVLDLIKTDLYRCYSRFFGSSSLKSLITKIKLLISLLLKVNKTFDCTIIAWLPVIMNRCCESVVLSDFHCRTKIGSVLNVYDVVVANTALEKVIQNKSIVLGNVSNAILYNPSKFSILNFKGLG